ncbi:ABC transporter permease [Lentilactobacillus sp. SPB1-3]|uniref:ABC transporter permease n=1 Tax=Lentilactobacillus terminaliae TaxID=3003483 RepID=A0ACD5DFU6_9LACO|nr:ABC transporter permease [Lentilactobacillus sp. SPB1-3]MCZ0976556.1 ABC transporter permease [Lentilactobacillus sp. SPB1-3]
MNNKLRCLLYAPYALWLLLFVIAPVALIFYYSFFNIAHHFTLDNYKTFFESGTYLTMTANSVFYAFLITLFTLIISYPMAYYISKLKHRDLWILLVILPTWINLLLKAYAFIGLLSHDGLVNNLSQFLGLGVHHMLFTNTSFILVAAYIQIPFMILPIYNSLLDINDSYIRASRDLGATSAQTFMKVILPLTKPGIQSGIQIVFIPSLSLFMLSRLIGGNKIITLGTAVEEHFLTTMNWGMGSTIGVVLIISMAIVMFFTSNRRKRRGPIK